MKKFIATFALLVITGFAVSAQQSASADMAQDQTQNGIAEGGCLPPPLQDYMKKTIRVEIKGVLTYLPAFELERDPRYPMPNLFPGVSQISALGKTYQLDLGGFKELAGKHSGQYVIVSGILDGPIIRVTDLRIPMLKDAKEHVRETTEVEARGQLQSMNVKIANPDGTWGESIVGYALVVDGKTYNLNLSRGQWKLAEALQGSTVSLTGFIINGAINVTSLKVAD